jgi:hypothetical protein
MNSRAWKSNASTRRPVTQRDVNKLRQAATVRCNKETFRRETNCNPSITNTPCLFNIHTDPCEENNLSGTSPDVATTMYNILVRHRQTLIPQLNKPWDITGADPTRFNNTWSSWLDWMSRHLQKYAYRIPESMSGPSCVLICTHYCHVTQEKSHRSGIWKSWNERVQI